MPTPGFKQLSPGQEVVYDIVGDGSGGYVAAVAQPALLGGQFVRLGKGGPVVYDIAGDGSLGYCSVMAQINTTGSGAVSAVFGRTGDVMAQSGDYTAAQVTNAVSSVSSYLNPAWITTLAGSKISGDISGNAGSITGTITESQVVNLVSDLAIKAPLASPTFTGVPAGPTPVQDTNTTQLATTAYVVGQASSVNPLIDGTAAVGTSLRYARQDHVHSTDTSRAPLASPTFTGVPAAPTAAANTNTTQIATTAFVIGQGYVTSATAPVTSVFGRTGAVVAVGGDYTSISQASGSVSVTSDGSITVTPASTKNVTLSSGQLLIPDGSTTVQSLAFATETNTGIYRSSFGSLFFRSAGGDSFGMSYDGGNRGIQLPGLGRISWNTGAALGGTLDLHIQRDAANTLAQRNGTNAQKKRLYETFTDASNGSWFEMFSQAGGPTLLRSQANGTGTVRDIWLQNQGGRKRVTADVTNATATMSNLSDLSVTLIAGRKYTGRLILIANDSQSAEGLQFDCNGGTATMTNFQMNAEETPIGATLGTTNSTSLANALNDTAVSTTDTVYCFNLTMVVNAGGTFIPRFAQNSHTLGTATVRLGSYLWLEDSPN